VTEGAPTEAVAENAPAVETAPETDAPTPDTEG